MSSRTKFLNGRVISATTGSLKNSLFRTFAW